MSVQMRLVNIVVVLASCFTCLALENVSDRIFTNSTGINEGRISITNQTLIIQCFTNKLEDISATTLAKATITRAQFISCPIPTTSYKTFLTTLDVDYQTLSLNLTASSLHLSQLRHKHVAGLNSTELIIIGEPHLEQVQAKLSEDVLQIATLKTLSAKAIIMPPLPLNSSIETVTLARGSSTGLFGGCKELKDLTVAEWNLQKEQERWLMYCKKYTSLKVDNVSSHVLSQIVRSSPTVQSLEITKYKEIVLRDNILALSVNLQTLAITGGILDSMDTNALAAQTNLKKLDLSHNNISTDNDGQMTAMKSLTSLQYLTLARNDLKQFCEDELHRTLRTLPDLRTLCLVRTGLPKLCFRDWMTLMHLNLSNNQITLFEFDKLPIYVTRERPLVVDLRNNPLRNIRFDQKDYETLLRGKTLYGTDKRTGVSRPMITVLVTLELRCDCEHVWFARAMADGLIEAAVATCAADSVRPRLHLMRNGMKQYRAKITDMVKQLECTKFPCSGCVCVISWKDNSTSAYCSSGLQTVPREPGLRLLHAPGGNLTTLTAGDLPQSLKSLDISLNNIARLDAKASEALFAVKERRVWFAGNPLVCDCENLPLLTALLQHRDQVQDLGYIRCAGTGDRLTQIVLETLCDAPPSSFLVPAVMALVTALIVLVAALFYSYRARLKRLYQDRRQALDAKEDEDREFDVFLSYAHGDARLVTEELLPVLERPPFSLTVCVHHRDWLPGEMIPTQIARSVNNSRRTLILLSNNFIASMWSMLEFHSAYTSSLKEKRKRVIVIVLDDVVDSDDLDDDLRCYLNTSTYIRWGSVKFWERLRKVLPRSSVAAEVVEKVNEGYELDEGSFESSSSELHI